MQNHINLTDDEKRIIVDYISCAVGEGYTGDKDLYNTQDIDEKLVVISEKLGFSRNDVGIEYAVCKLGFEKNGIQVNKGERCYYNENPKEVNIITENKKHLELTQEEANKYF